MHLQWHYAKSSPYALKMPMHKGLFCGKTCQNCGNPNLNHQAQQATVAEEFFHYILLSRVLKSLMKNVSNFSKALNWGSRSSCQSDLAAPVHWEQFRYHFPSATGHAIQWSHHAILPVAWLRPCTSPNFVLNQSIYSAYRRNTCRLDVKRCLLCAWF